MKTLNTCVPAAIAVFLVMLIVGCLPMTDAEREKLCKENQLSTPANEAVNYVMNLNTHDRYPDEGHILFNSIGLDLSANIYLIDCYGDEADHQTFSRSFTPSATIPLATTSYDLPAVSGLRFTFHNSRDYLKIKYSIKAFFADGAVYQSDTMTSNSYRYSTLNQYSKPIVIKLYQDGLAWNKLP